MPSENDFGPIIDICATVKTVLAGLGLVVILAASVSPAQAMSPGSCQTYAHRAVEQFYLANRTPACGEQSGPRWHNDFAVHYNWCLQSSDESIRSEANARRELLRSCVYAETTRPIIHSNGNDASCCPNSMLVCPLGRHFCH